MTRIAWIAVVLVATACGRREDAPDEGGRPAWVVQDLPECGYSVELPGPATRDVTPLGGLAHALYVYDDGGRQRFMASCTTLRDGAPVPSLARALELQVANHRVELAAIPDLEGVDHAIEASGNVGRWMFRYKGGATIEGRLALVGRQVHEVSGASGPTTDSRATLERVLASYKPR